MCQIPIHRSLTSKKPLSLSISCSTYTNSTTLASIRRRPILVSNITQDTMVLQDPSAGTISKRRMPGRKADIQAAGQSTSSLPLENPSHASRLTSNDTGIFSMLQNPYDSTILKRRIRAREAGNAHNPMSGESAATVSSSSEKTGLWLKVFHLLLALKANCLDRQSMLVTGRSLFLSFTQWRLFQGPNKGDALQKTVLIS